MICIEHRSLILAQGLLLDIEAGKPDILDDRFNGRLRFVNHFLLNSEANFSWQPWIYGRSWKWCL